MADTTTWTPIHFRTAFWESPVGEVVELVQLGCTVVGMLAYYPIFRMKNAPARSRTWDGDHGRGES